MTRPIQRVNYDAVAARYDRRYDVNWYDGITDALQRFVGARPGSRSQRSGVERGIGSPGSPGSPARGSAGWPDWTIRGRCSSGRARLHRRRCWSRGRPSACRGPTPPSTAFLRERAASLLRSADVHLQCRRVLRPGGGLLTIGLDPHHGADRWWIYEFFPAALAADRRRYTPAATIRTWLGGAGFRDPVTELVQHLPVEMTFEAAEERGFIDRASTSQLMVISDDDYESGLRRLLEERPILRSALRLYATTAWV